ncbi:hypothetical protein GobsT_37870 [Gemmata obscuriglobus]|uniref:Uncharacterized protein n=1 Tax=Gemmata obscuriglobus TaxID=114 RepID=A0A2Z3GUM5_9BACT|nr:hypothetical protein [Gemmata obscuriglobus]AWM38119.1 hypothetical protein C1280_14700 [Gemmata obscuriglobus]QEG28998.1 hypothetical protein GobsT_37870 [Gemmata obscuriglobus]VTS07571.1 unnamed protein product [Gemmata obscuriglobus UQM 2246]
MQAVKNVAGWALGAALVWFLITSLKAVAPAAAVEAAPVGARVGHLLLHLVLGFAYGRCLVGVVAAALKPLWDRFLDGPARTT